MMATEPYGTAGYFPSLLSQIHDAYPDIPIDTVIFQAILLCLVAGKSSTDALTDPGAQTSCGSKYLLLRTREEDVSMVANIVVTTLTTVFGLPSNKSRIKPTTAASLGAASASSSRVTSSSSAKRFTAQTAVPQSDQFLRSLFFRPQRHSRVESILTSERDRRNSSSRRSARHFKRRSATLPPENVLHDDSALGVGLLAPSVTSHLKDTTDESFYDAASMASSRRPLLPDGRTPASTLRSIRPQAPRLQTDPTPLISIFQPPSVSNASAKAAPSIGHTSSASISGIVLPKALVVSGLEHTEISAQRALTQVLTERRLVLENEQEHDNGEVWNLPEDFIFVYVCPSDASDRPPILPGLLDKFSMSVDVTISPTVRQTYNAYRALQSPSFHSPSPRSPTSPLKPLTPSSEITLPTVNTRPNFMRPASAGPPPNKTPIITSSELARLRALTNSPPLGLSELGKRTQDAYTSIHPSLNMYLADLFSATRHHPELNSSLLTLRAHRDAADLVRAFRVISGDSLGTELISSISSNAFANGLRASDEMNRTITSTEGDAESSRALSKADDESLGWGGMDDGDEVLMNLHGHEHAKSMVAVHVQAPDASSSQDVPFVIGDLGLIEGPEVKFPEPPPEVWDVSEVDIARIFPRVVSHRLKVRKGPDDEILGSLMFPAAEEPKRWKAAGQERTSTRRSVKEILVEILSDV